MSHFHRIVILFLALLPAFALSHAQSAPFPLTKSTYWTYRGKVSWDAGSSKVETKTITWKMEVTDTIQREGVTAALVNGFVSDLAWYEPGKQPALSLLVETGSNIYVIESAQVPEARKRLRDPNDLLQKLVTADDLLLSFPLERGKKFCDAEVITRTDNMYCWIVEEEGPAILGSIQGAPAQPSARQFQITQRTYPDHQFLTFVPGIGITRYQYAHHGTPSEADVELVEFHPAPSR